MSDKSEETERNLPAYDDAELANLSVSELLERMVRDGDRVPRNVIDACAGRGAPMVQALRQLIEDDEFWSDETPFDEWWLRLHAVMILGMIPGEEAGRVLVASMRRMAEAEDDDLQDWLGGYWPALFRNKPQAVLDAVRDVCLDRALDWYVRSNATEPVVADAARQGEAALERALDWLARIVADEDEDWDLRLSTGTMLLHFPRERHRGLLEELARQQSGIMAWFTMDHVQQAYARGQDDPEWSRFRDPWAFYTPSAIAKRQRRWAEDAAAAERARKRINEREAADRAQQRMNEKEEIHPSGAVPAPYVRAQPKVGRNDPCPCGSGKKFKKCHGAPDREVENMDIYQLKITLKRIKPPIWRRIEVPASIKLGELHDVLQDVMGWEDAHMHQFMIGNTTYGVPDREFDVRNENATQLSQVASEGGTLVYEYDFGDSWEHLIEVEKVSPAESGKHYPVCIAGKRACPPEDCGGAWGYENLLATLSNPDDEEYEEMREWAGEDFDPEALDLDEVNAMLARLR
jgi:hypothetical protein